MQQFLFFFLPATLHPERTPTLAITVHNTRDLVTPSNFKLRILLYGLPGCGKSTWAATAPNPGFIACETGHGAGLLGVADKGMDYIIPTCLQDFEPVLNGTIFKDKETLVLDSLSEMQRTFIKDAALAIPRSRGESDKRRKGIPELDDYGIMAELTRRALRKLLDIPKHIIVTATERYDKPDPENGQGELLIGPDLPGQMFLGSTAMFDLVLRLRTRQKLRDPRDAKSRFVERYFIAQADGSGTVAKSRLSVGGAEVLGKEEPIDLVTGQGTFPDLLHRATTAYEKYFAAQRVAVTNPTL